MKPSFDDDSFFIRLTTVARYGFITLMLLYLFICLGTLAWNMGLMAMSGALFDFGALRHVLTDALFTLIILAIVKTLYINNNFDYAVTFLEIGFVVILRKLILIEILPEELGLVIALGGISALFFGLIIVIYKVKKSL